MRNPINQTKGPAWQNIFSPLSPVMRIIDCRIDVFNRKKRKKKTWSQIYEKYWQDLAPWKCWAVIRLDRCVRDPFCWIFLIAASFGKQNDGILVYAPLCQEWQNPGSGKLPCCRVQAPEYKTHLIYLLLDPHRCVIFPSCCNTLDSSSLNLIVLYHLQDLNQVC